MEVAAVAAELARAGCVFAEEEAAILLETAADSNQLADMLARRAAGEPLEHVVGWTRFCGLRLEVDHGVFVPRPRTALLVHQAIAEVRRRVRKGTGVVLVDLCCGTGAIAAAVAAVTVGVEVHAADTDPRAVACAERNLARWGGQVHHGDLFDALPSALRGTVDVVVASPPYVPTDQVRLLPSEAREHEALTALDGGPDGLDLVRRIALDAQPWLVPGGWLAVEVGESQVDVAAESLTALGYQAWSVVSEELGSAVVLGSRPAGPHPG